MPPSELHFSPVRILILPSVILVLGIALAFVASANLQRHIDGRNKQRHGLPGDPPAIAGIGLFGHYSVATALRNDVLRVTIIVSVLLYSFALLCLWATTP